MRDRARGLWRRAAGPLVLLAGASCSGGGQGGCTIPGATVLPGGYPVGQAVAGAGALRVTRAGLDVLATSASSASALLGSGPLSFPVPSSTTSGSFDVLGVPLAYTVDVCPGGADPGANPPTCALDVEIPAGSLHLDAVKPGALTLSGTVPIRLRDLPLDASFIGALALGFGQGTCHGAIPDFDYGSFPVSVSLPLVAETTAPRAGLTKVDVASAVVTVTADPGALGVCGECAPGDAICQTVLDTATAVTFPLILAQVEQRVKAALAPSFCTRPDPTVSPSCPVGSGPGAGSDGATVCLFDAAPATCVPVFFGTEGALASSALLGSAYAPVNAAPLDFLLAAGGALDPAPAAPADDQGYAGHTPNGATFSLLGGITPATVSPCVPSIDVVPPADLPLPSALTVDTVAGWPSGLPGPHVGVAFAGRYLDYALARTFQSGALCLEISTAKISLLSTGLLSLLVPALPSFTFEGNAAALDVRVRPQVPPTVTIGTGADTGANSIVTVHADSLAFDFYVFSDDEYVRAFTFTGDATIPLSLTTAKTRSNPAGGITPVVGQISFAHPVVTSSDLLSTPPATIASGIELALSTVVGQLFTALPGLDPSTALAAYGLTLDVPPTGFQKVTEGSDDFVAIFAALSPAASVRGRAPVGSTRLDLTRLTVDPAGLALVDATRARLPTLSLSLTPADARPREYAWWLDDGPRSAWSTETATVIAADAMYLQGKHVLSVATRLVGDLASEGPPATLPFLVDVLPPTISRRDGSLQAWDIVSPAAALQARLRREGTETWGEWSTLADAQSALAAAASPGVIEVRDEAGNVASLAVTGGAGATGSPSIASGGAGGCRTGGDASGGGAGLVGLLVAGGLVLRRRSRRLIATGRFGLVALVGCGGDNLEAAVQPAHDAGVDASVARCGADCLQACQPALDPGVVGAYASLAAAPDGTVWVAGYSDAVITGAARVPYGDLVVGRYDAATGSVAWKTVDGVPARASGTCPDHDPSGWRGGETSAGDDVGLWTSLGIDANGEPMVAYFDATHGTLKLARFDGTSWAVHTVTASGVESGRYAKLALVAGVPTVSYLVQDRSAGTSRVELASATTPAPASAGDWALGTVAAGKSTATTEVATELPLAYGDYVTVASAGSGGPLSGVAFYDEPGGNLVGATPMAGGWTTKILAGGSRAVGSGDDGQDASLVIDRGAGTGASGDWHVVYVDAARGQLDYLDVIGGTTPAVPSVVDDGTGVGGQLFTDGVHLVGAGAQLTIDGSGVPRVYYGDATAGTLRVATGARSGAGATATYTWTLAAAQQSGRFAGLFPLPLPDRSKIGNAYRTLDAAGETHGDFVFVSAP